jgi:hypothetical protein
MQSTHHRTSGWLALAAAVLGTLAVFPPYDKLGSLAEDPSDLFYSLVVAAVVALAGMLVLGRARNAGLLLLVGITGSVFAGQAVNLVNTIREPGGTGLGFFMDKTAFVLLVAAAVLAVMALRRTAEVGMGMSMSAFALLAVGFFLLVVYVVGEIIPLGEVTARDGGAAVRFTWGALFDGDDSVSRAGHILGIVLAGGSLLLASLVKPLRLGVAVLAGWAMAEMASVAGDSVKLLLPETIDGTRFTGEIGLGLVARVASLLLTVGLVAAVAVIERRRSVAPAASEADEPMQLVAV